jgi:hypothetical protein
MRLSAHKWCALGVSQCQAASIAAAGVGRTGWHIDGSFQTAPFSHALYHIVSCPTQGNTGEVQGFPRYR